ncbi:MAG: uracil-DNA glycosylase [Candidatus Neomarinimicrobiota bacterium]
MPLDRETAMSYLRNRQTLFGDTLILGEAAETVEVPANSAPPDSQASANQVNELAAFEKEIRDCRECALGATRTKFVFGVGNPAADLVFVGEAPGQQEDLQGEPFVGRAGKLLDRMLAAIDLSRREVYILNVLKCRPPGNRDPEPSEVAQCQPYLNRQLSIIRPRLVVALGRVAAKTLLKVEDSLKNMRVQVFNYEGIETRVTYHPAALLRNSGFKSNAWVDFQAIRDRYRELTGLPPVEES